MQQYSLIIAHLIALALLAYAPYFWIKRDAAAFGKDVAKDAFHATFHRQRLTWRVGFAVAVAGLASLPCVDSWKLYVVSFAALLAIGAGWHAYVFNPGLNVARKLPYVGKYYVSADPRAAYFPDRWAWGHAMAHYPPPATEADRRHFAELLLKTLLRCILLASLAAYAAGVGVLALL